MSASQVEPSTNAQSLNAALQQPLALAAMAGDRETDMLTNSCRMLWAPLLRPSPLRASPSS